LLIIFDLDDTLIDTSHTITRPLWRKALEEMIQGGLQVEDFSKALFHLWALDQNTQSSSETLRLFLSFYQANISLQEIGLKALQKIDVLQTKIQPLPGVLEGLKILQAAYTLAVVSKGVESLQREKLKKAGIDTAFFSKIVISEEGNKKVYYKKLFEELKEPPQNCTVVGDRVLYDLKPAKELQMRSRHMKWGRGKVYSPWSEYVDQEIYSFKELISYFEKLSNLAVLDGN